MDGVQEEQRERRQDDLRSIQAMMNDISRWVLDAAISNRPFSEDRKGDIEYRLNRILQLVHGSGL